MGIFLQRWCFNLQSYTFLIFLLVISGLSVKFYSPDEMTTTLHKTPGHDAGKLTTSVRRPAYLRYLRPALLLDGDENIDDYNDFVLKCRCSFSVAGKLFN